MARDANAGWDDRWPGKMEAIRAAWRQIGDIAQAQCVCAGEEMRRWREHGPPEMKKA